MSSILSHMSSLPHQRIERASVVRHFSVATTARVLHTGAHVERINECVDGGWRHESLNRWRSLGRPATLHLQERPDDSGRLPSHHHSQVGSYCPFPWSKPYRTVLPEGSVVCQSYLVMCIFQEVQRLRRYVDVATFVRQTCAAEIGFFVVLILQ